ncbi:FixH family protein [Sedimenticola hydrogenitrophicus]|uniref:FixH family protein n=1 Tax=Sedimenticola hydrogenitrophicus TaxID=2967975 RepID=UPI0023B2068C|nr:FixH family protein [Sedimenticola hydrogenitrophicus]
MQEVKVIEMTEKQSPWRNPWVQGWVGLLVVFVAANLVMVYLAVTNNPGLVVDDYYERGQEYEKNMLKRQARNPGWQMKVIAPERVDVALPARYGVRITGKDGHPVAPDSVTFHAYRPADAKQDFSVPMQATDSGVYEADISFPRLGVWDILISAKRGDDEYNLSHRVSAGVN